jgi:hypothetical protein
MVEPKEKADIYLKLGEEAWNRADTRRSYEWKFNLALWPALGILAGFLVNEQVELHLHHQIVMSLLLLALLAFYAFVWSEGMYKRNTRDIDKAHYYWAQAEKLCYENPLEFKQDPPSFPRAPYARSNWSHSTQILITCVFIFVVILLIWGGPPVKAGARSSCADPDSRLNTSAAIDTTRPRGLHQVSLRPCLPGDSLHCCCLHSCTVRIDSRTSRCEQRSSRHASSEKRESSSK